MPSDRLQSGFLSSVAPLSDSPSIVALISDSGISELVRLAFRASSHTQEGGCSLKSRLTPLWSFAIVCALSLNGGGLTLNGTSASQSGEFSEHHPSTAPTQGPASGRAVFLAALREFRDVNALGFEFRLKEFVNARLSIVHPDAVENRIERRALLVGLGALFDCGGRYQGTPIVGRALDNVVYPEEAAERDRICTHARLGGRHDAPKHFFLAALLTSELGPGLARHTSIAKEREDARGLDQTPPSGSGFSFLDLAYDLGGVHLASWLLGWKDPSRLEQVPPPLEHFLPDLDPLRLEEGIGWNRFQAEYRGERFLEIFERIQRAIQDRL